MQTVVSDRGRPWNAPPVLYTDMCLTGIILFVVPPGRIANWTGWTIFGLTKHQWIGLHIWLSSVFTVAAVVHLYLNWCPMVSYLKSRASQSFAFRMEWVSAMLICGVVTIGTLADITPFSSLLAWNEAIKHRWDDSGRRAPVAHAEMLTLAELANQVDGIDLGKIIANLSARGIQVESAECVVGDLAAAHNMTPHQLYEIAVGKTATGRAGGGSGAGRHGQGGGQEHGSGQGIGRMTLKQYCTENGLDLNAVMEKLQRRGLESSAEMTIRGIVDAAGTHPSEIRGLLE